MTNLAFNTGYISGFMGGFLNRFYDFYEPRSFDFGCNVSYIPFFGYRPSFDLTDYWCVQRQSGAYRFDYSDYRDDESYSYRDYASNRYRKFFDLTKKLTKTDDKDTKVKKDTSSNKVDGEIDKSKGIFLGRPVTSGYGMRRDPISGQVKKHRGIDLKYHKNEDVCSFTDGVVTYIGYEKKGYGKWIEITDNNGVKHRYAHANKIIAKLNQEVKAGEVIMLAGSTGKATGPHVHYETIVNGQKVNPFTTWA